MKKNHIKCFECAHLHIQKVVDDENFNCDFEELKICKTLDVAYLILLREDYPGYKFKTAELLQQEENNIKNASLLQSKIRNSSFKLPKTSSDFKSILKEFHSISLINSKLKDLGCFRKDNVFFDIGKNHREGISWNLIENSLDQLWNELLSDSFLKIQNHQEITYNEACWISAHFLSQFFRIHPFRDANGRVGRFFVQFFMSQCGFFILFNSNLHKKYFKSLRYSHKKYDEREIGKLTYKHSNYTTFINKYLYYYLKMCSSSIKSIGPKDLVDELN